MQISQSKTDRTSSAARHHGWLAFFVLTGCLISFAACAQNYDGKPDPSFGIPGLGWSNYAYTGASFATAIARQSDGKILAAGTTTLASGHTLVIVMRLNTSGFLDTSFGAGTGSVPGIGTYFFSSVDFTAPTDESASAIAVQSDGKIVVAGTFTASAGGGTGGLLFRLLSNGAVDASFGNDGGAQFLDCDSQSSLAAIALLPDDRILTAGTGQKYLSGTSADFCVVLHDANGHPLIQKFVDFSDGTAGVKDNASAIAVAGNRVIVAGSAQGRPQHLGGSIDTNFAVAALTLPNLDLDPSFGPNPSTQPGLSIVPFDGQFPGGESADVCRAVAIGAEDIVLGGEAYVTTASGTVSYWAVAKLFPTGISDVRFGGMPVPGEKIGIYQSIGAYNGISSLVLQQNSIANNSEDHVRENIIFGGNAYSFFQGSAPADFGIHRMLFNGDSDSTFGSAGNVIFSPGSEPGNGSPQYVTALLLDGNRPLVVGVNYTASNVDFLFLRLQNDKLFGDGF